MKSIFYCLLLMLSLAPGLVSCVPGNREKVKKSWNEMRGEDEGSATPNTYIAQNGYHTGYEAGQKDRAQALSRQPARHASEASPAARYYWNRGYDDGWRGKPRR